VKELFGDTSVSKEMTIAYLDTLRGEIDIMIESLWEK
jgi:hypothetical protein